MSSLKKYPVVWLCITLGLGLSASGCGAEVDPDDADPDTGDESSTEQAVNAAGGEGGGSYHARTTNPILIQNTGGPGVSIVTGGAGWQRDPGSHAGPTASLTIKLQIKENGVWVTRRTKIVQGVFPNSLQNVAIGCKNTSLADRRPWRTWVKAYAGPPGQVIHAPSTAESETVVLACK